MTRRGPGQRQTVPPREPDHFAREFAVLGQDVATPVALTQPGEVVWFAGAGRSSDLEVFVQPFADGIPIAPPAGARFPWVGQASGTVAAPAT